MGKQDRTVQTPPARYAHILHRVARILAVLFAVIIIHESLIPVSATPNVTHFDKLMHLIAYGALGVMFKLGWPKFNSYLLAAALISLGGGIEIAQAIMASGRTGSLADGLANSVGVGLGIGFAILVLRVMHRGRDVSNRNSFRLAPEK